MSRHGLDECSCGSKQYAPQRLDGYGIFLTYACDKCWPEKKKRYSSDIDSRYECDEQIEAY